MNTLLPLLLCPLFALATGAPLQAQAPQDAPLQGEAPKDGADTADPEAGQEPPPAPREPTAQAEPPAPARNAPELSALQVSSFASMRAARMEPGGAIDTGAGVLVLYDDSTGKPLVPRGLRYAEDATGNAQLWLDWSQTLGPIDLEAHVLGMGQVRNGDDRLKVYVRLAFQNRTGKDEVVRFGARLLPGDGDAAQRPVPSLPFKPGLVFARDGNFITRDGAVLATWVGLEPEVLIPASPTSAQAPGCELHWTVPLPAQNARYLDILLAGPPASDTRDESAWRAGLTRWGYAQLEETLLWQSEYRGFYADFECADRSFKLAMVSAVFMLRMLGDADREIHQLTDRLYGQPASDAAVPAEMAGLFTEWNWVAWAEPFVASLVDTAVQRGQALSPARRVVLVHGLARAVRLGMNDDLARRLAAAIRALITEPAEVEPWFDPAEVRLDLQGILDWAGPPADGAAYELPELRWATGLQRPADQRLQALRRALSDDDVATAWAACQDLVARTTISGFFRDDETGELDWRTTVGFMTLVRCMLLDDHHGDDLHLFPHIPEALIPRHGLLYTTPLPTRFGLVQADLHYVGPKGKLGATVVTRPTRTAARMLLHVPAEVHATGVQGTVGGSATLQPDGTIDCWQDPNAGKGLRFNIKLRKE